MAKAKVITIPVPPDPTKIKKPRKNDPRFVEGQRILVDAMRYLAQNDLKGNRVAIELLSEHFRTKFRMSDHPLPSMMQEESGTPSGNNAE